MRFTFSEEQRAFRDAVRGYLENTCAPDAVRHAWDSGHGSADRWRGLAEIGLVGALVGETAGGLGVTEVDVVLAVQETGRAGLPEPLVEVLVASTVLAEIEIDGGRELLREVVAGTKQAVYGPASSAFVAGASDADLVIVEREGTIRVGWRDELEFVAQPSLDRAHRLAQVVSPLTVVAEGEAAARLAATSFNRGAFATAAQLIGNAERCLELGVSHAREREQFGQPIGAFQAVKHLLADALVELEFARPAVYRAACALASSNEDVDIHVSLAKALASRAARLVAGSVLQVHGAIGYTWEHDLHLWLKRATSLASAWGDEAWHRDRIARYVVDPVSR